MKKFLTLFTILIMLNAMSFVALGAESEEMTDSGSTLQIIERKNAPLNPAFSKQNLDGINVSDATLQEFSNFFVWVEEQGIDAEAEGVHLIYVDDDLQAIPNSWVFTLSDYKPTLEASKDKSVEKEIKAKDEMISYLSNFEKKYPVKKIDTGLVTFITIENKEVLLAEISEQDIQMLESISDAIMEDLLLKRNKVLVSNWSSGSNGNPNVHGDMARWAAEKAGFNSTMVNRISSYADDPDDPNNMTHDSDLSGVNPYIPSYVIILGNLIDIDIEGIIESNYNHYFNPLVDLPNNSNLIIQYILNYYYPSPSIRDFGGAPVQIYKYLQRATTTSSPVDQRAINLSYASHFVCDLSMPFHTNEAALQAVVNKTIPDSTYIISEPHFLYENDYVGQNWTSGLKFSSVAKNANYAYGTTDPVAHSRALAAYSHPYAPTILLYISNNNFNNINLEVITDRCLFEGQAALNGLMVYGKNSGI